MDHPTIRWRHGIKKADPMRKPAFPTGDARYLKTRSEPFAFQTLALHLARTAHGFSGFTRLAFRRLFIVPTQLHFPEDAFALHLLLEGLESLIDVIITNENLHWVVNSCFKPSLAPAAMGICNGG
ncbi:hypothetical protein BGC30_04700 [Novacetimonas hansenii]|nr:hypothetical protein BGC30_04700 [Novacetimonas hansenii]